MQTVSLLNHPERHRQAEYSGGNIPAYLDRDGSQAYATSSPQDEYNAREYKAAADFVEQPELTYPGNQDRLFRAVQRSYQSLDGYREMNRKLVEEYGGTFYQQETTGSDRVNRYVNLIQQAVETYQMLLAANRPRAMISTSVPDLQGFAGHYEHALNLLIKEIGLEDTMKQWVMDAFFCIGVIKSHLGDAGLVQVEADRWMDPGRPFASNIALDDFVYDMKANKWAEVRYAGDMYSMAWEDAEELFGDVLAEHVARGRATDDVDRVDTLSRGTDSDTDDFEDMIDLADIWVPRYDKTFTYVVQSRRQFLLAGNPIAVEEWTGDEHGMYHLLCLGDVPENIMPASPASHLEQLDSLINDLLRKCARQGRRQKDVNLYTSGGAPAASQIQLADDGEWVNVNDVSDISTVKQGGVDPGTYAFLSGGMELFDRMAGNLQTLSGLGSAEKTARQAGMVNEAATNKVDRMSKTVIGRTNQLLKALGQMLWQDQFLTMSMQIPIEGTPYSANSKWDPGDREGNVADYNFETDVFSLPYQSPASKLASLDQYVQSVVMPMAPFLQQQGGFVDMIELNNEYSKLLNYPNLRNIIKFGGMPTEGGSAVSEIPRKPPNSTRNYVRHNVSGQGGGQLGESGNLMNAAASAAPSTPGGMT